MFDKFDSTRMSLFEIIVKLVEVPAIAINLILIVLILRHSGDTLKNYAKILLILAVADTFQPAVSLFIMIRIVPVPFAVLGIFHGACRFLGQFMCTMGICCNLAAMSFLLSMHPFSFWFRYRVVFKPLNNPKFVVNFYLVLVLTPLVIFIYLNVRSVSTEQELYDFIANINYTLYPPDPSLVMLSGSVNMVQNPESGLLSLYVGVMSIPSFILSVIYRRKILKMLEAVQNMSSKVKAAHKSLVKALTIQLLAPVIYMYNIITYSWIQYGVPYFEYSPYMEEYCYVHYGIASILNAVATIYFVVPYRQAIMHMLNVSTTKSSFVASPKSVSLTSHS